MGLFAPKWKTKNRLRNVEAVKKVSDTAVLKDIVLDTTVDIDARLQPISQIQEPAALKEIAERQRHRDTIPINSYTERHCCKWETRSHWRW